MISAVEVLITRALMATTAFALLVPTPRVRIYPGRTRRHRCWCVVIAAELRDRADDDRVQAEYRADFGRRVGVRAVAVRKILFFQDLSSALRSITEYWPPFTSFSTSMSLMPWPTSWSVPKNLCDGCADRAIVEIHHATRFLWTAGAPGAAAAGAAVVCAREGSANKTANAQPSASLEMRACDIGGLLGAERKLRGPVKTRSCENLPVC